MIPTAVAQRLKQAEWLRRDETQRLFALLDGAAGRTRAVGGVVRDTLLERLREAPEIDFATELMPDEVMRRAGEVGIGVYPTGIEHGTVTLKLGDLVAEVTTLREDVETDGRRAKVRFGTDWRHDAERRDFTLNALYASMDGELFDPINGGEDCLAGRVRFIGDPDQRIVEDRLRVFRFFRFSASHGQERLDADGLAAVTRAAGDLGGLSAERVGHEMRRVLDLARIAKTLHAMTGAGILTIAEPLLEQFGVYERRAHRPNFAARLSLLLAGHSPGEIKDRWRLSNDEITSAEAILAAAQLLIAFHLNEAAYRYPAALADAVEIAATLAGWTEAGKSAVVQHLGKIDVPRFPLSGGDLVARGMKPGPELGAELDRLERVWIESGFALDREALLKHAQR
ncbi:MAG: CCA tRNA nucleotidyltransferase [Devosia sp.]|nr:CCA tRNA nucleotidyltransferase [Devosia sp.]